MKLAIVFILLLVGGSAPAQVAPAIFESGNKNDIYIYPEKKPYPFIVISEENYNPVISFNILISSTTVVSEGAILFLENGSALAKPDVSAEYVLSDVMGYSELVIKVPLNQSDVQLMGDVLTDHLQIGNLPVALTDELKSGLRDQLQIIANRIKSSPEESSAAVNRN